jgi:hypothetical protein
MTEWEAGIQLTLAESLGFKLRFVYLPFSSFSPISDARMRLLILGGRVGSCILLSATVKSNLVVGNRSGSEVYKGTVRSSISRKLRSK